MPPVCSLCRHSEREAIDAAIVLGKDSLRNVAKRYGTSPASLLRHREHIPGALVLAREAEEVTKADDLLGILREAVADARRLRGKAEAADDYRGAIACVKTLADLVESLVKVAERIAEKDEDLTKHPEWLRLREAIADALDPYPEALNAVRTAIRETDLREPAPVIVEMQIPRPSFA